eukprot:CAMPEP_0115314628 /NCGR_PEP_ID=MMETSP0270-20121206/77137_1 /TAXON_ID=71861 /ORGANISM="Scrippsiella trochoidea, Strain CCMP3099" /LENGTH=72 /DNA_ID=CAMNT_0002733873 /DNA_START=398 /DNA_END=616 /DNA_ORIENTATION=+
MSLSGCLDVGAVEGGAPDSTNEVLSMPSGISMLEDDSGVALPLEPGSDASSGKCKSWLLRWTNCFICTSASV